MKAIVLTKSKMKSHGVSGVCTTAYDLDSNKILRLVSNEDGGPIPSPYNKRYECLDIINARIVKPCPIGPQQENVLIDLNSIENVCHPEISMTTLFSLCKGSIAGEPLYMNDTFSRLDSVEKFKHSLEILRVKHLEIANNKWDTTKAAFTSADEIWKQYKYFSVKDPNYMIEKGNHEIKRIDDAYIVVSIPYDPYYDNSGVNKGYYKFIAAIYPI